MDIRLRRYIELRLENYPRDARQLADYSGEESAAIARSRAVVRAINAALDSSDRETRDIIRLVFFEKRCNVIGAAMRVYLSQNCAYLRVRTFVERVAEELGEI